MTYLLTVLGQQNAMMRRSVGEALWGMCAADAMSMPVHWYYTVRDIKTDFGGWITGYQPPKSRHPSSILTLSNSAGSGRSSLSSVQHPPVVGSIILHDKLKFWKLPGGSVHYHQGENCNRGAALGALLWARAGHVGGSVPHQWKEGLVNTKEIHAILGLHAGQNTLNTLCAVRVARVLAAGGFCSVGERCAREAVLADYLRFMTTPGSHDDTYAESFHRAFFSEWQEERPTSPSKIVEFAERRYEQRMKESFADSQLDAIGCLPMAIPFILLSACASLDLALGAAVDFVRLTHPHPKLERYVTLYAGALHATLNGACLRQQAEAALRSPSLDVWDTCKPYMERAARFPSGSEERLKVHQSAVASLGLACYTKGALSSLFYLAHEFHDDLRGGILANTNCGGENCNRGAALGALLGARAGHVGGSVPHQWKEGLVNAKEIHAILED